MSFLLNKNNSLRKYFENVNSNISIKFKSGPWRTVLNYPGPKPNVCIFVNFRVFMVIRSLKVHAGNLDKKGEKNKSFKNIYIFGFSRPC